MSGMSSSIVRRIASPLLAFAALAGCQSGTESPEEPLQVRALPTPAAIDSMAPQMSSGPDGTVVLSWLEGQGSTQSLRFARLEPAGWSAPMTVASSENWFVNYADRPSVVPLTAELWAAHWLELRAAWGYAYDVKVVLSTDAGRSWSAPITPHTDDTDTQHGFVSMYASGNNVGLLWLDGRKYLNEVSADVAASAMTLRAASITPELGLTNEALVDDVICDCCQTDVAQTSAGPVAVYRDRSLDEIRDIYITRYVDGTWQTGRPVHDDHWEIDGCPVNGPVVEAQQDEVAVVWFTGADAHARVQAAWSSDAGLTFAPPVEVAGDRPLGHVGAALLPDGDLIVSWQRAADGPGSELCLRRVSRSGALGPIYVLQQAADIFPFSVPQLVLQNSELIVAWTSAIDDRYQVNTAGVPLALLR
jgi:hypothetical protein